MSMVERSPDNTMSITRPVLNIGEQEVEALAQPLMYDETSRELFQLDNLLRPSQAPVAEIIGSQEFRRVLRSIGIKAVSEGHIEELTEYMEGVFNEALPSLVTPTLPVKVRQIGSEGKFLSVGTSPMIMRERLVAKQALAKYYGHPELPPKPLRNDAIATPVWLARSFKAEDNWKIRRLHDALKHDESILPKRIEFGSIAVKAVIPQPSTSQ